MTTPALFPPVPKEKHPSWQHQLAMFWFVVRLWAAGMHGAYLACDMGVGKSKTAIDLIAYQAAQQPEGIAVLIVCPMRVCEVWDQQLETHAAFPYHPAILDDSIRGGISEKARIARDTLARARSVRQTAIVVVNYESAWQGPFAALALNTAWTLVIADECHRIKQASGRQSHFFGKLAFRALYRLALSGTPMTHSPLDVWAQFRFLDPTIYDSTYFSFKTRYAELGGYMQREIKRWRDLDDLTAKFYRIAIRFEAKDVLDLPPEMDQTLYCTLSPGARKVYRSLEQDLIAYLDGPEEFITADNSMVLLLRLQQLTGGTLKSDDGTETRVDHAKEDLLADWLEDLAADEPVVVFAKFWADLDAIARASARAGRTCAEMSGRLNQLAAWKASRASVLAAQIQTAGEGQDFTHAHYCAYYSIGYSLKDYVQSRKRLHRPGQTRPVVYFHLLVADTIDPVVLRAVEKRWDLVEQTLQAIRSHHAVARHPHTN
jgi:SNF2 family DNA or RNA helicase